MLKRSFKAQNQKVADFKNLSKNHSATRHFLNAKQFLVSSEVPH